MNGTLKMRRFNFTLIMTLKNEPWVIFYLNSINSRSCFDDNVRSNWDVRPVRDVGLRCDVRSKWDVRPVRDVGLRCDVRSRWDVRPV